MCDIAKRKKPDPATTEKWATRLTELKNAVNTTRQQLKIAEAELNDNVRAAFNDGVLVGPMIAATGLSSSRLFQIKHALRDAARKAENNESVSFPPTQ